MAQTRLGAFLVARRAQRTPDDVGTGGRRRVAGLRREEVAVLAGVSTDYYTRLEQGRERSPSPSVLAGIARALDLGPDARDHLFRLAGARVTEQSAPARPWIEPGLRDLLDAWPGTPAVILNHRLDVLASNALADALYSDFTDTGNLVRMTFLDPAGRTFFADWDRAAQAGVANLRLALGRDPHDRVALDLVAELAENAPEFRSLWDRQDVHGKTYEAKTFRHQAVGELTLSYHSFDVRGTADQQLIVYQAAPGSRSAQALTLLGLTSKVRTGTHHAGRGLAGCGESRLESDRNSPR